MYVSHDLGFLPYFIAHPLGKTLFLLYTIRVPLVEED